MFQLSSRLRIFSIVFLVIGAIGMGYSFFSTPSSTDEAKELMAPFHKENNEIIDSIHEDGFTQAAMDEAENADFVAGTPNVEKALKQFKVRPWSGTFIAAFFFFMIALGVLVFQAVQYVSEAGWSPVLYRVFEGITNYVLPGSIIVALIVILAGQHFYPWQNSDLVAGDEELQVKALFLNKPFFYIRILIYLLLWNGYRYMMRRNSLAQVDMNDYTYNRKNHDLSTWFVILFGITESPMAWDWFMSLTPHWFSALYAWYIFASLFVSGITVIALVTIYLKSRGYLEFVNDSHIHDLAKYIFAFSIFWTYFWFAQFMLIWYANIPEEASYFVLMIQHYKVLFFGMLILNFVFPIVILMNADFKRINWIIVFVGLFLLVGHYIDIYLLVTPATRGVYGQFGIAEIAPLLFFGGLFILIVGNGLAKVPLRPKGDPFIKESEHYEY